MKQTLGRQGLDTVGKLWYLGTDTKNEGAGS